MNEPHGSLGRLRNQNGRMRRVTRQTSANASRVAIAECLSRAACAQLPVTANQALPPGAVTNTIGATHGCGSVSL
jgi:hypothetical protein